jgi:hypothetical protein
MYLHPLRAFVIIGLPICEVHSGLRTAAPKLLGIDDATFYPQEKL